MEASWSLINYSFAHEKQITENIEDFKCLQEIRAIYIAVDKPRSWSSSCSGLLYNFNHLTMYVCACILTLVHLTIEHMDVDGLGLSVGGVALVFAVVGGPCRLYQQVADRGLPLLSDHADTSPRRVVADYLVLNTDKWSNIATEHSSNSGIFPPI